MKHKLNRFFKVAVVGAAMVTAAAASAQMPMAEPGSGANYGLLGQNYYGLEYSYIHHVWKLPHVIHKYGFQANSAYAPGLDLGFRWDWETGSQTGIRKRSNTVSVPFTLYKHFPWGRPFLHIDPGYRWQTVTGTKSHGLYYSAGVGAEIQVKPNLVVTPFFNHWEAKHQHEHAWEVGGKGTLRVTQDWSVSFTFKGDEHSNLYYTLGANMHF